LKEKGIDVSGRKPRKLIREMEAEADIAVIVCSGSECPVVNVKHVEHWGFEDPAEMSLEEAREVVNRIEAKVRDLAERITRGEAPSDDSSLSLSLRGL
jgi:arsenate reductase